MRTNLNAEMKSRERDKWDEGQIASADSPAQLKAVALIIVFIFVLIELSLRRELLPPDFFRRMRCWFLML